jgi:hypothetical protein
MASYNNSHNGLCQPAEIIVTVVVLCDESNILSSRLLSKNIKVRIYKTIILPVVLYGCETWSLTLREEYLDQRGMKRQEVGENCIMRSFITCTLFQV